MINQVGQSGQIQQLTQESGNKEVKKVPQRQNLSKIDRIKQEIEAGTYRIDLRKTAERIAEELRPSQ